MKNLIKNSLVVAALFATLLGNASPSLNELNDEKRTTIRLNDVKQGDHLLIKDAYGTILYKEKIQNSGNYIKGFDLTELPDGTYFFELDNSFETKIIPFQVNVNNVIFNKEQEAIIYKPLVNNKDNKVYISKLSLNEQPLSIEVHYENENHVDIGLIYSETIENTKSIRRILSLNKLKKGSYKIVIKTEGRTFVDYVRI